MFAHRQNRFSWRLTMLFLLVLLVLLWLLFRFRPTLTTFAENAAKWQAEQITNESVSNTLSSYADLCRSMIQVSYNEQKILSSVMVDTVSVNTVKTAVTSLVMKQMAGQNRLSVSVPLGTLLGIKWLSGWGPEIVFPVSITSGVLSDVSSSLISVGINQSAFRVLIRVSVNIAVITPGGRSNVSVDASFPMAETVLLGEVPDTFTEVYGDDQSVLEKIFNYAVTD